MFKAIINAIGAALRAIGNAIRGIAAIPGNVLHSILGGGGGAMSDIPGPPPVSLYAPEPAHADIGAAMTEVLAEAHAMDAAKVQIWSASSLSAGAYQSLPAKLPRDVEKWLPGLRFCELLAIIEATPEGVSAHLRSQDLLPGVRSVRPLAPIAWNDDALQANFPDCEESSVISAEDHARNRDIELFRVVREAAGFQATASVS
jgi:hypothetical protein